MCQKAGIALLMEAILLPTTQGFPNATIVGLVLLLLNMQTHCHIPGALVEFVVLLAPEQENPCFWFYILHALIFHAGPYDPLHVKTWPKWKSNVVTASLEDNVQICKDSNLITRRRFGNLVPRNQTKQETQKDHTNSKILQKACATQIMCPPRPVTIPNCHKIVCNQYTFTTKVHQFSSVSRTAHSPTLRQPRHDIPSIPSEESHVANLA